MLPLLYWPWYSCQSAPKCRAYAAAYRLLQNLLLRLGNCLMRTVKSNLLLRLTLVMFWNGDSTTGYSLHIVDEAHAIIAQLASATLSKGQLIANPRISASRLWRKWDKVDVRLILAKPLSKAIIMIVDILLMVKSSLLEILLA